MKSWHEGSLSLGAQPVVVARQARTLAQQRGGTPANGHSPRLASLCPARVILMECRLCFSRLEEITSVGMLLRDAGPCHVSLLIHIASFDSEEPRLV